jgi:hypothetical protein
VVEAGVWGAAEGGLSGTFMGPISPWLKKLPSPTIIAACRGRLNRCGGFAAC